MNEDMSFHKCHCINSIPVTEMALQFICITITENELCQQEKYLVVMVQMLLMRRHSEQSTDCPLKFTISFSRISDEYFKYNPCKLMCHQVSLFYLLKP